MALIEVGNNTIFLDHVECVTDVPAGPVVVRLVSGTNITFDGDEARTFREEFARFRLALDRKNGIELPPLKRSKAYDSVEEMIREILGDDALERFLEYQRQISA